MIQAKSLDSSSSQFPGTFSAKSSGWALIALIVVAGVLGGGGASSMPYLDAAVEFVGFAVLALLITTGGAWRVDPAARGWLALAVAAFLLPVAQLVPLPREFVVGLPGRELAGQIQSLEPWRATAPLTLDPDRTIISALAVIPGVAAFAAALRCSARWRRRATAAWLVVGVVALLLGVVQVASGGQFGKFYDSAHRLAATGFFANRNHHALFMLLVLLLAAGMLFGRDRSRDALGDLLRYAFLLALAAGVLTTTSRAGIALLVLAAPALALLVVRRDVLRLPRYVLGVAIAGIVGIAAFLALNPVASRIIGRFSLDRDARLEFWPDVLHTVGSVWQWGTGIGTFDVVFATQERLGSVGQYKVLHAHNDFLELLIEGGLPALALIVLFVIALFVRIFAIMKMSDEQRRMAGTGLFGLVLALAHSCVDYPLRAATLTVMFGFMAGLMFRPPVEVQKVVGN